MPPQKRWPLGPRTLRPNGARNEPGRHTPSSIRRNPSAAGASTGRLRIGGDAARSAALHRARTESSLSSGPLQRPTRRQATRALQILVRMLTPTRISCRGASVDPFSAARNVLTQHAITQANSSGQERRSVGPGRLLSCPAARDASRSMEFQCFSKMPPRIALTLLGQAALAVTPPVRLQSSSRPSRTHGVAPSGPVAFWASKEKGRDSSLFRQRHRSARRRPAFDDTVAKLIDSRGAAATRDRSDDRVAADGSPKPVNSRDGQESVNNTLGQAELEIRSRTSVVEVAGS